MPTSSRVLSISAVKTCKSIPTKVHRPVLFFGHINCLRGRESSEEYQVIGIGRLVDTNLDDIADTR